MDVIRCTDSWILGGNEKRLLARQVCVSRQGILPWGNAPLRSSGDQWHTLKGVSHKIVHEPQSSHVDPGTPLSRRRDEVNHSLMPFLAGSQALWPFMGSCICFSKLSSCPDDTNVFWTRRETSVIRDYFEIWAARLASCTVWNAEVWRRSQSF